MPGQNLTRVEAQERAGKVFSPEYRINLDLSGEGPTFRSETTISFGATPGASTFVDLISPYVEVVELNGQSLGSGVHRDSRLELENLEAENTLRVVAQCEYMHTGEGLHRFVDPVDNQAYVYSQFEVPDARRVFAVFEQPDLKATYQFTITTPEHWKVFSNAPSPTPQLREGRAVHEFEPTEKMSSYITAIVAGPYAGQVDTLTSSDGREIPLGVYCRASMVEYLDAEEIFQITKDGFAYYEKQFDTPYPFRKYDQVFVPEFNAGAMENAGIVTYRDAYVFRSKPTEAKVERRVITILHELAHMWFGDLVTMKWWNDLWLNESFAEYMSHLCAAEATAWADCWTTFSAAEKAWAYRQDQLPSTHPIVAPINDLEDVQVNFDGITYAKGACVLTQLVHYVGRENFFTALQRYFKQHAWGNTVLEDLLTQLSEASGKDLQRWSQVWLEEAGMTWLRPAIECDENGVITKLEITQEAFSAGASLRPHRLVVSGYNLVGEGTEARYERVVRAEFDMDGERTAVPDFVGQARPDVILVNDEDLAYAKVRLDEASLEHARYHICAFEQSLPRSIILAVLWDMVRDGEYPASDFLWVALESLLVERNSTVVSVMLGRIDTCLDSYLHPSHRAAAQEVVGKRLARLARFMDAGSDTQLQLIRAAAKAAATTEQHQQTRALLQGEEAIAGLHLDPDLRWYFLVSLAAGGQVDEAEIAQELAQDDTVNGRERALEARAARPQAAAKAEAQRLAYEGEDVTNDQRVAIVAGYNRHQQPELTREFVPAYFESLEEVWRTRTMDTAQTLVAGFYPFELVRAGMEGDPDIIGLTRQWLEEHPQAAPALRRLVSEQLSTAERAWAAQLRDEGANPLI